MDALEELRTLLKSNSVRFGKFRLASGRESDFFIDCKQTLLTARGHLAAGQVLLRDLREHFEDAEVVAGVELGGCPLASAVALCSASSGPCALDALYVRKARKDHGTGALVEGRARPRAKVVLLEDVFTSGESALRAVETLTYEGFEVVGVVGVVDRLEGAQEAFKSANVRARSIFTRNDLEL